MTEEEESPDSSVRGGLCRLEARQIPSADGGSGQLSFDLDVSNKHDLPPSPFQPTLLRAAWERLLAVLITRNLDMVSDSVR